jgi:lipoyl-dependent peroxiredoxin
MPTRTATAKWQGGFQQGSGSFNGASGLAGIYSKGSRFENAGGSNPEELLAAAEAACFAMALTVGLEKEGFKPTSADVTAACTIEKVGEAFKITRIALDVTASVPGIDDAKFQSIAEATKEGCPVSSALKGNVQLDLTARLAG